jgi:putative endonuclease
MCFSTFVRRHAKTFYVYILASPTRTLYTGFTSDLQKRLWQHRSKSILGFSSRYQVTRLVYYEVVAEALAGIAREKQIKGWSREKKIELIKGMNPEWEDLSKKLGLR